MKPRVTHAVSRHSLHVALAALVLVSASVATPRAFAGSADHRLTGEPTPPASRPVGPRLYGDYPTVAQMTDLGRRIFNDTCLSSSGRLSCAGCHDPGNHFAPANALPTQKGGPILRSSGLRATPSLTYLQGSMPFTEHYIDDEDGHGVDAGPSGGLTWDGRANSVHAQALLPLFDRREMDNGDARQLARRLSHSEYADAFRASFSPPGGNVFDDPEQVVRWVGSALEVYQESAADFYPFSSKFDAFLRHQVRLTETEARGLALFNDPGKGNCASCHPSSIREGGAFPIFTDAGAVALGVPRNRAIEANRRSNYYDLGLCGPLRADLKSRADDCGRFKAPSLRNVATRRSFFHNGSLHQLRDVVDFYVTRDLEPERWYPPRGGHVVLYDDLPARYRDNVNKEAPFAPLPNGQARLSPAEIDDVVAFLQTLSDGWQAPSLTGSVR